MLQPSCCICTAVLVNREILDEKSKEKSSNLHLRCCGRIICARCVNVCLNSTSEWLVANRSEANSRLSSYCPFCQKTRLERVSLSSTPNDQHPPPYTVDNTTELGNWSSCIPPPPPEPVHTDVSPLVNPPTYNDAMKTLSSQSFANTQNRAPERADTSFIEDTSHYLLPTDTLTSLSLAYAVPLAVLRSHNHLHSDHLLSARQKINIPRSYYNGPSLSPHPVQGEEENKRKTRLRRFMVRCKCVDYKIAGLYLEEYRWDLEKAIRSWREDEQWENDHPMPKNIISSSYGTLR